jgi:ubiquinone biosynthesis protein
MGRNRDPSIPSKGRFTRTEIDEILTSIWERYDESASNVPWEPKVGNRINILLACLTFACLEIMIQRGVPRQHAIELIGDASWNVYRRWGKILIPFARLYSRDPRKRMRLSVNAFLRFPFTPPGYRFERVPSADGIALNMLRCPVADYLGQQQASDLCVGTWCNLDFALAEMWGGWLERSETLAAGCDHCNFHFKVKTEH